VTEGIEAATLLTIVEQGMALTEVEEVARGNGQILGIAIATEREEVINHDR